MRTIPIEPLTKAAFAPFGDVVEAAGAQSIGINQGFAERVNGLAGIDVADGGGSVNISLFNARARPRPIAIVMMERHPHRQPAVLPSAECAVAGARVRRPARRSQLSRFPRHRPPGRQLCQRRVASPAAGASRTTSASWSSTAAGRATISRKRGWSRPRSCTSRSHD